VNSTDVAATPFAGFFRSLYDLSFQEFVTPRIIRVIYVIALIVAGLWSISLLIAALGTLGLASQMSSYSQSMSPLVAVGLFQLVGAPIAFVLLSIATRIYLEFAMAVFRIAENTEAIRRRD
jgi:hypothetical protein